MAEPRGKLGGRRRERAEVEAFENWRREFNLAAIKAFSEKGMLLIVGYPPLLADPTLDHLLFEPLAEGERPA